MEIQIYKNKKEYSKKFVELLMKDKLHKVKYCGLSNDICKEEHRGSIKSLGLDITFRTLLKNSENYIIIL